jgi:hypothetical protein
MQIRQKSFGEIVREDYALARQVVSILEGMERTA